MADLLRPSGRSSPSLWPIFFVPLPDPSCLFGRALAVLEKTQLAQAGAPRTVAAPRVCDRSIHRTVLVPRPHLDHVCRRRFYTNSMKFLLFFSWHMKC